VQLIAADMLGPLKLLKTKYGIRTVITEPVEVELRHIMGNQKFRDMKHVLTKALGTNLITVLDESLLGTLIDPAESAGRLRALRIKAKPSTTSESVSGNLTRIPQRLNWDSRFSLTISGL
jgi:hypothetical protein